MDIDKKKAFLSKRKALKSEKIYLDDDLTPIKKTCHECLMQERKENGPYIEQVRS